MDIMITLMPGQVSFRRPGFTTIQVGYAVLYCKPGKPEENIHKFNMVRHGAF